MKLLSRRAAFVALAAALLLSPVLAGNDKALCDSDPVEPAEDAGSAPDIPVPPPDTGSPDTWSGPQRVTVSFRPDTGDVLNPGRGLFRWIDLQGDSVGDLATLRADGMTLGFAPVSLAAYRNAPLPQSLLQELTDGFDRVRAAGVRVVLRFRYSDDARGLDTDLARVLAHIAQLGPLVTANADAIAALEAGLIGAWGEWHSSANGLDTPENRAAILQALLDATPPDMFVLVRTPMYKDAAVGGPVTEAAAFSGLPVARVGLHNDCFLASDDDFGTYEYPVADWKDFAAQDSRFVPVGGETCNPNPPRSDCPTAEAELALFHFSYLNTGYHPDVIAAWQSQGCFPSIQRRLGYRLVLAEATLWDTVHAGDEVELQVWLENEGMATLYRERPVVAVLIGGGRRYEAALAGVDPRDWAPGRAIVLDVAPRLPCDLPAGSYDLALHLPDPSARLAGRSEYAIRFANQGTWDAAGAENVLYRDLTVLAPQPGCDPGAADFERIE